MAAQDTDQCRDCGGKLHEIVLLDCAHGNMQRPGLAYTLPGAKRGFWSSQFPTEGKVASFICESCGRIMLYGQSVSPS